MSLVALISDDVLICMSGICLSSEVDMLNPTMFAYEYLWTQDISLIGLKYFREK